MMQMKLRWIAFLFFTLVIVGVHAQQRHSDGLDDVLQYVPYASVLTLKACGVESRDEWPQLLVATAGSWVVSAGVAYTLKHSIHEWRPDNSDNRSFPSGHTTFAFAGATVLHKEFGHGAAIGFLSTELTYYVTDRLFPKRNATLALTTNSIGLHLTW